MGGMSMWVARDEDGDLYLYGNEPVRGEHQWLNRVSFFIELDRDSLPEVKWEDGHATEVEVIIKRKNK